MNQHRECIEIEEDSLYTKALKALTKDADNMYDRGVMDERQRWENKTCETCKANHACDLYKDGKLYDTDIKMWCDQYEPKGNE